MKKRARKTKKKVAHSPPDDTWSRAVETLNRQRAVHFTRWVVSKPGRYRKTFGPQTLCGVKSTTKHLKTTEAAKVTCPECRQKITLAKSTKLAQHLLTAQTQRSKPAPQEDPQ